MNADYISIGVAAAPPPPDKPREVNKPPLRGGLGDDPPPRDAKPTTKLDIQKVLNDLIWERGPALPQRTEYPDLLKERGLTAAEITPDMIKKATQASRDRLDKEFKAVETIKWKAWVEEEFPPFRGKIQVWRSTCGLYKVARLSGLDPRFAVSVQIVAPGARERLLGDGPYKDIRTLERAYQIAEEHHRAILGHPVASNKNQMVEEARKNGLHRASSGGVGGRGFNQGEENDMAKKVQYIEVTEEAAKKMLAGMGLTKEAKFNKGKLHAVLENLKTTYDDNEDGLKDPDDVEDLELRDKILDGLAKNKRIALEGYEPPADNGAASSNGHATAKAKSGEGWDQYGFQKAKRSAAANATLKVKPKTAEKIAEEIGQPVKFVQSHFRHWIKKGEKIGPYIVETDKGFALKS